MERSLKGDILESMLFDQMLGPEEGVGREKPSGLYAAGICALARVHDTGSCEDVAQHTRHTQSMVPQMTARVSAVLSILWWTWLGAASLALDLCHSMLIS